MNATTREGAEQIRQTVHAPCGRGTCRTRRVCSNLYLCLTDDIRECRHAVPAGSGSTFRYCIRPAEDTR